MYRLKTETMYSKYTTGLITSQKEYWMTSKPGIKSKQAKM